MSGSVERIIMAYEKELKQAIEASRLAGEKIIEIYQKDFDVHYKEDTSPVTSADIAANKVIINQLKIQFPKDGYLSEEMEDDQSRKTAERFWVIDPLDGTKEFVKRNGEFSVNIGLIDRGALVLGVVYLPVKDILYYAVKDQGAYCTRAGKTEQIHVSDRVGEYKLLISRSHPSLKTQQLIHSEKQSIQKIKEMGSSIKGCLIAQGDYDVYYNFGRSMKWDTCAVEIVVTEAGGIFRRLDGEPIDYMEDSKENDGFYILNHKDNGIDLESIKTK